MKSKRNGKKSHHITRFPLEQLRKKNRFQFKVEENTFMNQGSAQQNEHSE